MLEDSKTSRSRAEVFLKSKIEAQFRTIESGIQAAIRDGCFSYTYRDGDDSASIFSENRAKLKDLGYGVSANNITW
jgi:hypothetical protein